MTLALRRGRPSRGRLRRRASSPRGLAATVLGGALMLVWVTHPGSTASVSVPASVAQITKVVITGGRSLGHTPSFAGDGRTITAMTVRLQGSLTLRTVTGRFDGGLLVGCALGTYNAADNVTPVTCSGLAQDSRASSTFTVTIV